MPDKVIEHWDKIACPICDSTEFTDLFTKDNEPFVECQQCSLTMINPRPRYANILKGYTEEYSQGYINKKDKKIRRAKRRVRKMKKILPEGRWLDIGCSAGFILSVAKSADYETYGIEIDPLGVKHAREILGLDNIFEGTFEEHHFDDNFFDIITMYDVIEHVQDLNEIVKELKRILSNNGVIEMWTPDIGHWRVPKLLIEWEAIKPSEHLYYFNKKTLSMILHKHGLKIIRKRFSLKPGLQVFVTHE
ncbi:MAG: class I SAM-dependent methyltransferase [Gammaproteobacteria bacterium]|nr:class I SAM-dependent methyltransferase [Gammaproteobacteria bacterium]MCK5498840.1 class I SAM-dependent methyltransferase [Gammaproteobacteria bacterium]MCK5668088.1 class I SAM-dependent methyltransferase [Gammaproteobacteria bacterium]